MADDEAPIRDQLVEARKTIVAQLDELNFRATAPRFALECGPPDYRGLIAELQEQLREIDALLNGGVPPDP